MSNPPLAEFLADFKTICSKSNDKNALKTQLQTRDKYKSWFDAEIHEKVLYLDQFDKEEQELLKTLNPLFFKWIRSKSMVTSVKIESKAMEVKQGEKQHSYLKYSAEIGTVEIEGTENKKQYQLHKFDFWKTEDERYFCRRSIDNDQKEAFAEKEEPRSELIEFDASSEYIHSTAELLTTFINERDNFVDKLNVDVKLWSQRHTLDEKFRYVRKLSIVHNSPSSTDWWMSQVEAMKTIPELTILNNHKQNEEVKVHNCNVLKNPQFESMPYTFPLKKRETPGWVLYHFQHPVLSAQKLNIETNVENPLWDLSKMSSLTEINMCRAKLDEYEFREFLRMWSLGHMGHRLERVSIKTDNVKLDKSAFEDENQNEVQAMPMEDFLCDNNQNLSEDFKKAARMEDAEVYLVRRQLPARKHERIHRTSCQSADSGVVAPDVCEIQHYGAFALVQVTKNSVHFTAVRNPAFANELAQINFTSAKEVQSPPRAGMMG